MNADLRQKWIDALRSGEYKQGFGVLRYDDAYCALGVLCDVAGAEWKPYPPGNGLMWGAADARGNVFGAMLPPSLRASACISDLTETMVARLNDKDKLSFESIARFIERCVDRCV